jgi:hypothetical protein
LQAENEITGRDQSELKQSVCHIAPKIVKCSQIAPKGFELELCRAWRPRDIKRAVPAECCGRQPASRHQLSTVEYSIDVSAVASSRLLVDKDAAAEQHPLNKRGQ